MAIGDNNSESTEKLQTAVTKVQRWTRTWRIKLNETKSVHIDFTNKCIEHKPIYINYHVVPYENTAKYLGMTLNAKLRWKPHVKKKKRKNSN
jgi:predicted GIY-YIG superfamily endonuclease